MASLIWSAILSGWPSVTDSEVKRRRATWQSFSAREASPNCTEAPAPPAGTCAGARSGRRREPVRHKVPDHVGERLLGPARDLGHRAVGGKHQRGVVAGAKREPRAYLVDHEQVAALGGKLRAAVFREVLGLRGKAGEDLAGTALRDQLPQDVGILDQFER